MRIKSISAKNVPPVNNFEVENLSDIVVLAGPNGVGKSRFIQHILNVFQAPQSFPNTRIVLEATDPKEEQDWGKKQLDTTIPQDIDIINRVLHRNQRRVNWKSSILNFESDRSIQQVNAYQFTWDNIDSYQEEVGWNSTLGFMRDRFQDTLHSILRKIEFQKRSIANRAIALKKQGKTEMSLEFEDPLIPFKDAFSQLLAPKQLLDLSTQEQRLKYEVDGAQFDALNSLSSGEREVVNILFDFILRSPENCIVFFDEPELHLHPELSYKLIQTLKTVGKNNQFILCTHSPDIITSALDNTVIFLSPPKPSGENQAIVVSEDDATNQALKLLGQSIGIVALGKKIVLVEGKDASLDKQVYGSIIKNKFPNLVLVPTGNKGTITSFSSLVDNVLSKSIWGVDFFMLADHDGALSFSNKPSTADTTNRFKVLSKYHLENYFLDETIWVKVFEKMEPEDSWLRSPEKIVECFKEFAGELVSYTVGLNVSTYIRSQAGNIDIMPKDCHGKTVDELKALISTEISAEKTRINDTLETSAIDALIAKEYAKINASITDGTWKELIPGKSLLARFCSKAQLQIGKAKLMYLTTAMELETSPFEEIVSIFKEFNETQ